MTRFLAHACITLGWAVLLTVDWRIWFGVVVATIGWLLHDMADQHDTDKRASTPAVQP